MLIDTNIALYLLGGDTTLRDLLDGRSVHVSFVTEMELLSYPSLSPAEREHVHDFLGDCAIFDLSTNVKQHAIRFRRWHDALIASTADVLGQPFLTADRDFEVLEDTLSLLLYEP